MRWCRRVTRRVRLSYSTRRAAWYRSPRAWGCLIVDETRSSIFPPSFLHTSAPWGEDLVKAVLQVRQHQIRAYLLRYTYIRYRVTGLLVTTPRGYKPGASGTTPPARPQADNPSGKIFQLTFWSRWITRPQCGQS